MAILILISDRDCVLSARHAQTRRFNLSSLSSSTHIGLYFMFSVVCLSFPPSFHCKLASLIAQGDIGCFASSSELTPSVGIYYVFLEICQIISLNADG